MTALSLTMIFAGCLKVENYDLNTPTTDVITQNPTIQELNNLVIGTESSMRLGISTYLDDVGVIGREMYRFSGSEPRWTTDMPGGSNSTFDSNGFYIINPWGFAYADIKNAYLLQEAAANCKLITDEQKKRIYRLCQNADRLSNADESYADLQQWVFAPMSAILINADQS